MFKLSSILTACLVLCLVTPGWSYSLARFARPQFVNNIRPVMQETIQGDQLLVECIINGYSISAIIDTGAQLSIMSESLLKKCRLSQDMDTRYTGKAIGIGQSDILGRVLNLPIQMGPISFKSGVSVLKDCRVEFIIGMDMLDKFESEINLKDRWIKFKSENKEYIIPFTKTPLSNTLKPARKIEDIKIVENSEQFGRVDSLVSGERRTVALTAGVVSNSLEDTDDGMNNDEAVSLEGI
jgi:hypothetical protein